MTNLKNQLIRLGNTNPELRKDLRPILDHITHKTASRGTAYIIEDDGDGRHHVRFDPPYKDIEGETHEYAVFSTNSSNETLVFPANRSGRVTKMMEIAGGRNTTFEEVLGTLGYRKDLTY